MPFYPFFSLDCASHTMAGTILWAISTSLNLISYIDDDENFGNSWGSCYFLPSSCRNDWVVDEVNRTWFLVQYNVQSEDLLT
jgi:hypothetical protein